MNELELLGELLDHEEAELRQRAALEPEGSEWRIAFAHKARMAALVRDWINEMQLPGRPGRGGYSRCANHFHEHGELLAVFEPSECLAAMTVERAGNGVADGKLDAVG